MSNCIKIKKNQVKLNFIYSYIVSEIVKKKKKAIFVAKNRGLQLNQAKIF